MPEFLLWMLATIGAVTLLVGVPLAIAQLIRVGQGPRDDGFDE